MTEAERRAALEAIAAEVRSCTRCRLHETRTRAVPGEGHPSTEVVFVGEGPGQNEDRQGRPFVGRAGDLLVKMLATIGWRRDEVFITNVVKCRPPDNRDPEPDEVAACAPYLRRQLEVLDPALVVTLGRHSLGRFMPGARISQVHGTNQPVDPATGARSALAYALYHPAAALRSSDVERQSYEDVLHIPEALLAARARREVPTDAETALSAAAADAVAGAVGHEVMAPSTDAGAEISAPRLVDATSVTVEADSAVAVAIRTDEASELDQTTSSGGPGAAYSGSPDDPAPESASVGDGADGSAVELAAIAPRTVAAQPTPATAPHDADHDADQLTAF